MYYVQAAFVVVFRGACYNSLMSHSAEHAPGTTTVFETMDRDWLKFTTIGTFNDAFVDAMSDGALLRRTQIANGDDAFAIGAIDARESSYKINFLKFWRARGMDADDTAAEAAWKKVRTQAVQDYARKRMLRSEPAPAPAAPEKVAPATTTERPLEIMDASQWLEWDDKIYSEDVLHRFTASFLPALAEALRELPSDMQRRAFDLQRIKNLYQDKLFKMYMNRYPERPDADEIRKSVQQWLDDRWRDMKTRAERFPVPNK